MKIVNCMSHSITDTTTGKTYEPSGLVVRAKSNAIPKEGYSDLNVSEYTCTLTTPLPEPKEDTIYVVSNMTLSAIPKERTDIVGPGPVEKDENFRPVGCRGFRSNK